MSRSTGMRAGSSFQSGVGGRRFPGAITSGRALRRCDAHDDHHEHAAPGKRPSISTSWKLRYRRTTCLTFRQSRHRPWRPIGTPIIRFHWLRNGPHGSSRSWDFEVGRITMSARSGSSNCIRPGMQFASVTIAFRALRIRTGHSISLGGTTIQHTNLTSDTRRERGTVLRIVDQRGFEQRMGAGHRIDANDHGPEFRHRGEWPDVCRPSQIIPRRIARPLRHRRVVRRSLAESTGRSPIRMEATGGPT